MDRSVVTDKFKYTTPSPNRELSGSPDIFPAGWRRLEQVISQLVKDTGDEVVRRLEPSIHRAAAETELLRHENEGLRASLATKNKRRGHGKRLPLKRAEKPGGGATFWSPRKISEARAKLAEIKTERRQEQLKKDEVKDQRAANKLYKQKITEERRVERERAKVVREKERAEKATERERLKQQHDAAKALQLSQKGKRKASQAPPLNKKRQKRSGDGAATEAVLQRASAPPVQTTSRGRNVHLPSKFR
jgi:hypothetical protein